MDTFANPGAVHQEGVAAQRAVREARHTVARLLGVQPTGITFTSGGTESNNLAIRGVVEARRAAGVPYAEMTVLTTQLEHPATLETCRALTQLGVNVAYVPVGEDGRIKLPALETMLTPQVVLLTLSYVNSEIGTIEAIGAVARVLHAFERSSGATIMLHADAAQAPLWLSCQLASLQVDLLSLDAGKFNGPKGVGVLAMQKRAQIAPVTFGGGQEAGVRPGTENVAGIVGLATALTLAQADYLKRSESVSQLRDYGIAKLTNEIPGAVLNGAVGALRVANNINISIPGLDSEYAVIVLDHAGIAASTKSACGSAGSGLSRVVEAVSGDRARATATIRLTLGPTATKAEIDRAVSVLTQHVVAMAGFSQ